MSIWGGEWTGGVGVSELDCCMINKRNVFEDESVPASERGGGGGSKRERERKIEQEWEKV